MQHTSKTFCAALAVVLLTASAAFGSRLDRKTELTVNTPIEIPGTVLPPGDYTMEYVNQQSGNHIVVFRKADGEVLTTATGVPTQRSDRTGNTKFTFYETPADQPPAMRTWFYPGDTTGFEFVYPDKRSKTIARYSRRNVPTMSDAQFETLAHRANEPEIVAVRDVTIYAVAPDSKTLDDLEKARAENARFDRMMWDSSAYLNSRELEDNPLASTIRKEIVTLPYYSLWDNVTFSVDPKGMVVLEGKVYRASLKKTIEKAVGRVEGVTQVDNKLEVLPVSPADDDIRMAAYRSIYGHSALQRYQLRAIPPIHIIVDNGNVALEGVVANQLDKNVAGIQASSVFGVHEVENNLRVEN